MKAMILSDLAIMKRPILRYTALLLAVVAVSLVFVSNTPLILLYVGPIQAFAAVQYLMMEAEKSGWEGVRLALPLSRAQVIAGRYASLALVAGGTILLAALLYVLATALEFAFPALGGLAPFSAPFDASLLALGIGGAVAVTLFLLGAMLPILTRMSATTGMRWALVALMLALMLGLQAFFKSGLFSNGALMPTASHGQVLLLAVGFAALGATFYAASATIAVRLYEQRDF